MQRVVPVTSFHLRSNTYGTETALSTFINKRMEFLTEERWRIPRIKKKKNRRELKSVC